MSKESKLYVRKKCKTKSLYTKELPLCAKDLELTLFVISFFNGCYQTTFFLQFFLTAFLSKYKLRFQFSSKIRAVVT